MPLNCFGQIQEIVVATRMILNRVCSNNDEVSNIIKMFFGKVYNMGVIY